MKSLLLRRNVWLISAIMIPLCVLLPWILSDASYPHSDASQYLLWSYRIFDTLLKGGWSTFLDSLYSMRVLKPTIQAPLGAIGLMLSGGEVLWVVRAFNLIFFTLFLSFSFLGLELFLPAQSAALGTMLLGVLPWTSFTAHYFGMELPILALSAGGFYWLIRARNFDNPRAAVWFGVCLGLSLCFRPMDAVLLFLVPIVFWVWQGIRDVRIRMIEIPFWLLTMVPSFYLFLRHAPSSSNLVCLAFVAVPPLALYSLRERLGLNGSLARAIFFTYFLPAVWYGPYQADLFSWIFASTYGDHAHVVSPRIAGFRLWGRFLYWLGGFPLFGAMAAAGLGLMDRARPMRRSVLALAVATAIFPLCVAFPSHDLSVRYYFSSAALLLALMLVAALSPAASVSTKKLRTGIIVGLVILCAGWDLQTLAAPKNILQLLPLDRQQEFFSPLFPIRRDASQMVVDSLAERFGSGHLVLGFSPQVPEEFLEAFGNIFTLEIIARERGYDWTIAQLAGIDPGSTDYALIPLYNQKIDKMKRLIELTFPGLKQVGEILLPASAYSTDGILLILQKK